MRSAGLPHVWWTPDATWTAAIGRHLARVGQARAKSPGGRLVAEAPHRAAPQRAGRGAPERDLVDLVERGVLRGAGAAAVVPSALNDVPRGPQQNTAASAPATAQALRPTESATRHAPRAGRRRGNAPPSPASREFAVLLAAVCRAARRPRQRAYRRPCAGSPSSR